MGHAQFARPGRRVGDVWFRVRWSPAKMEMCLSCLRTSEQVGVRICRCRSRSCQLFARRKAKLLFHLCFDSVPSQQLSWPDLVGLFLPRRYFIFCGFNYLTSARSCSKLPYSDLSFKRAGCVCVVWALRQSCGCTTSWCLLPHAAPSTNVQSPTIPLVMK